MKLDPLGGRYDRKGHDNRRKILRTVRGSPDWFQKLQEEMGEEQKNPHQVKSSEQQAPDEEYTDKVPAKTLKQTFLEKLRSLFKKRQ